MLKTLVDRKLGHSVGNELLVIVKVIVNFGVICSTSEGQEVLIHSFEMGRPKEDCHVGMELRVTVTQPSLLAKR